MLMTIIARLLLTIVTKTASIAVGGCPNNTKHSNEQQYGSTLFLIDHNKIIQLQLCTTTNRQWQTNAPPLQAILMAMRIRRYNDKCIAHDGRSRATLDAIGRCQWVSICPVLPRWTPWSSILAQKIKLWLSEINVLKLAFKRHKTDPLPSSLK